MYIYIYKLKRGPVKCQDESLVKPPYSSLLSLSKQWCLNPTPP
jgi:hypothetical protein